MPWWVLEPLAQVRGLRWQAQDISAAPPHRRPFGWLPQELGLWPHLGALAHLAFARTRGRSVQPGDADEALLSEVGLAHRANALPGQLSGGERQRLAFARVMALQPAWAVLDEPFSHLDPVMATELAQSFQALAARLGMGLIQVSHQVQRPAHDDWFWAMEDGALTQAGPWAELKTSPNHPMDRTLRRVAVLSLAMGLVARAVAADTALQTWHPWQLDSVLVAWALTQARSPAPEFESISRGTPIAPERGIDTPDSPYRRTGQRTAFEEAVRLNQVNHPCVPRLRDAVRVVELAAWRKPSLRRWRNSRRAS